MQIVKKKGGGEQNNHYGFGLSNWVNDSVTYWEGGDWDGRGWENEKNWCILCLRCLWDIHVEFKVMELEWII